MPNPVNTPPQVVRVSDHYSLGRSQPSLDFVDVPINGDARVFLDPRAIRLLPSEWGDECVALIQDYFREVLLAIQSDDDDRARQLLLQLREPNETRLGLSRAAPRGRALGEKSVAAMSRGLRRSEAARSGLLQDLEDTALMIPGVASDIVSDIATNIIREPLINYTVEVCETYGIDLVEDVPSGPMWDVTTKSWYMEYVRLPVTPRDKLLLVPKVIVRHSIEYDAENYYRMYILPHLQQEELNANSALVHLLKDGTPRVTKKDVENKYGRGKSVIVEQTLRHPDLLDKYRKSKVLRPQQPMDHADLKDGIEVPDVDWVFLLGGLGTMQPGVRDASSYHSAVEAILTALFYPSLSMPRREFQIHNGRKRIDISYTNLGRGFFGWVRDNYPAAHVFVECKNYSVDPANPELDQLQGRFSPSRGKLGLLVCRHISDLELLLRRCRDTAQDDRGYIIPLDDSDLRQLVDERTTAPRNFGLLKERFDALVM